MSRDRTRVPLEAGLSLDLARFIPKGGGKPGAHFIASQPRIGLQATFQLGPWEGSLVIDHGNRQQHIALRPSPRRLGGFQWFAVCPDTGKRARVLWKPAGASYFASRHAWRGRVAYHSQFLDPHARASWAQDKIKARLIGNRNPNEWDLPPKPKWMRWATYNRLEARFDEQEDVKNALAAAGLRCVSAQISRATLAKAFRLP